MYGKNHGLSYKSGYTYNKDFTIFVHLNCTCACRCVKGIKDVLLGTAFHLISCVPTYSPACETCRVDTHTYNENNTQALAIQYYDR